MKTFYVAAAGLLLCSSAVFGEEPSYAPGPFACEIRYNFRERLPDAEPGEKTVSASSHEREALPLSQLVVSRGSAIRIVRDSVAHLPYQFSVKITRKSEADEGAMEVSVCEKSGKPLKGFPKKTKNTLSSKGDSSRTDFEIPISKQLAKSISEDLMPKDCFVTYVNLGIGMDEHFLSETFPK